VPLSNKTLLSENQCYEQQRLLDAHNDMQKSLACGEFDFQNLLRIVKDLDENLASKINLGPSLAW